VEEGTEGRADYAQTNNVTCGPSEDCSGSASTLGEVEKSQESSVAMKCLATVLACCSLAWPQLKNGSVADYIFIQNELIVAADSRASDGKGHHTDTECKLRVLSNQVFFVATGVSGGQKTAVAPEWSTYDDAKQAWKNSSRFAGMSALQNVVHTAAESWAAVMQDRLDHFTAISLMRPQLQMDNTGVEGPFRAIEQGIFGATNDRGELAASQASVDVNLKEFDSRHVVQLRHSVTDLKFGDGGAIGLSQIVKEFTQQTSQRAEKFMAPYAGNPLEEARNINLARKLIERSIELHPQREFLGLPVDELTLRRGKGIQWLQVKPSCRNPG
jgi:hypothetical protein